MSRRGRVENWGSTSIMGCEIEEEKTREARG